MNRERFRTQSHISSLHQFLLIGKRDSHLLECYLIQSARYLQSFRLLIFLKAIAGVGAQLPGLLAVVKAALLKNRLCLFDLVGVSSKDRFSIGVGGFFRTSRPVTVLVRILILR